MAKFCGKVGYVITKQEPEGSSIWETDDREITYRGDIVRSTARWKSSEDRNDNVVVNDSISIIADSFADRNWQYIRYVVLDGVKMEVTSVQKARPRLTLSIGGVYNG